MNTKMSHLLDEDLIQMLKTSNRSAFTELYNRYWKKLFTAAANKLRDLEEAEDIVQQIFISIWNRREELEIHASVRSYLSVAVKYRVLKHLNARYKHKHFSDEVSEDVLAELADDSTQQWLEFHEVSERLQVLVEALPEKCRLVYEMSRNEGRSHKEIAAALDLSEKTIEWYITKAIKSIKSGLRLFFITL
ncbi:RNA polymerase sigma-70 factor [Sphingobacterium sp. SRCM116780]|uniref:RNA polymerase sigma-70 factor n=1 Tax=Sphingobacterium sp. SRCM116780 TaxID=2907623 RepID=UPI001F2507F7|nr:RNA polymerase sigma-70 factor [Sphingobacterium sp. SRCM116780]UIR57387.1 RNA polymerase sigma-70 factor [Sphingobacterium sp. SRCM116780]